MSQTIKLWNAESGDQNYRIILGEYLIKKDYRQGFHFYSSYLTEKDTLNIYLNGVLREETVIFCEYFKNSLNKVSLFVKGEFVDGGTDTEFIENGNIFILKARNSGNKHEGLNHTLTINGCEVVESPIL